MIDTPTTSIHTYLTNAPSSHFVGREVDVIDAWQGNENLLWRVECRGEEAVLKLFPDAGQARSRRQYDGQQFFASQGIAPSPLWYDRYPEGLSRQILVYAWMPGEPLDATDPQQIRAHAEVVAQLHSADVAEVRRFSPNPINLNYFWRIQSATYAKLRQWPLLQEHAKTGQLLNALFAAADAQVKATPAPWREAVPTAVHGDLRRQNACYTRGAICLLDWEMFGLGDPAFEVAGFLSSEAQELGEEKAQLWRKHYLNEYNDDRFRRRIELYEQLLKVRNVGFLLNGLQQLDESGPIEVESIHGLGEVTTAALRLAAQAYTLDAESACAEIKTLFGRLSRPE